MPEVGDSVDRYVLEAVLGEGGMGRVYRALDPRLHRRVALKVLLTRGVDPTEAVEARARMVREARAAAAFNHPNVVAIYDVGEVDESPFIAMELVSGSTLRSYVGDPGVPAAQRVAWLADVARGLGAAHRAGLVHRDIKPENIMVTPDGVVKILDFGIARRSDALLGGASTTADALPNVTSGNAPIGTPQYMAPEQIRGEPLDGRADQFAWGVLAFELLAGQNPWGGVTGLAVVAAVLSAEPLPLHELARTADPRVAAVVLRALAKSREARFASMEALVEALEGKRLSVPIPSNDDVAFAATTAQPVVSGPEGVPVSAPVLRAAPQTTTAPSLPSSGPRTRVRALTAAALASSLALLGVAEWRATHTPKTFDCLVLDDTRDGPVCAVRVGPEFRARRVHATARVTTLGHRVTAVEYVNFAGRRLPQEVAFDGDDYPRREIARDGDGRVRAIATRDANGVALSDERWSDGGKRVDLVEGDGVTPRHATKDARYTSVLRDFDERGRVVRERYLGPTGRPRPNAEGSYGVAIEYGATPGARVKLTELGSDGDPAPRRDGVAVVRSSDDAVPGGKETTFYDADGKPFAEGGVFRRVREWDGAEITSVAAFGLHGEPAFGLGGVVHEVRTTIDLGARTKTLAYFDEHGKPQAYRDRWFAAVRFSMDALGRFVLIESLDGAGNRTLVKSGLAVVRCAYDDRGNEVRREHLDPSLAPVMGGSEMYARLDLLTDAHGNALEDRYLDARGQPAPSADGVAIHRRVFDDRELELSVSNFDVHDKPATNLRGWATKRTRYDRLRNVVERVYLGTDGKPTLNDEGIAVERRTYDDHDDLVSIAYLDTAGAPTMFHGDYASIREEHDARGLVVLEEYLDIHGERALQPDGYAVVKRGYDRNGDVVLERYFGRNDEPVVREGGYAAKKTTYDRQRRPTEITLLDAHAAPVVGREGWAVERSTYDERGMVVRVDHEDGLRHAASDRQGRASTSKAYDARRNLVSETNLGVDGKPVVAASGWATKKIAYDARDQVIEESLWGASGERCVGSGGWSVHQLRRDDFGDVVEEAFFDALHQAIPLPGATFASERSRFDERHELVEIAYLDAGGAPAKGPDGVAVVRYERDAYGHAVVTAYLDGAGVPARSNEGKTTVHTRYDDAGRAVEELFKDGAGALQAAEDGCAGFRTRYDPQGHEVERACVGVHGVTAAGAAGWAIRRTLHDARGNVVLEAIYDASGAPSADTLGVAETRRRYDERDRLLEVAVFGRDGKPTHDRRGVHVTRYSYDEGRRQTGESAFDERGRPVATRTGP